MIFSWFYPFFILKNQTTNFSLNITLAKYVIYLYKTLNIVNNVYTNTNVGIYRAFFIFAYTGLFYDEIEIIPRISGEFRFDKMDNPVKKFSSAETEIRALIEGQFVAKRAHAEELGFHIGIVL